MNEDELLKNAIKLGIIDISVMREQIEKEIKMNYLSKHNYSIWQGSNGKWYTRIKDDNGNKKLIKRNCREDIEDYLIKFYKHKEDVPTFKSVFDLWVNQKIKRKEICDGTFDRYNTEFKRFFYGTYLYEMEIEEITDDVLEDFIRDRIVELDLTAKAYGNMRTLINGTMKHAKKLGYTDFSISSFFGDLELSRRVFKKNKHNAEEEVFSEEEIKKITKWLRENESVENLGLLLTFQCGIREGELSGLKYSDLSENKLHIQRQEVKYKDRENAGKMIHVIADYTKSDAGDRYIILTKSAVDTIEKIKKLNPHGEYLMMDKGRKIWTNTFNDRLYKACDKVGIARRSMHKIRKTYGTTLLDSGADDSLVMSQMGHSDIETTRKYYYYSNKNYERKVKQIESAILI